LAALPANIGNLKQLEILDVKANEITTLPTGISSLTLLKELNISVNKGLNKPEDMDKLKSLKALTLLDISYNGVTRDKAVEIRDAIPECKIINWSSRK
jgi:Leucine-rich repeat (LRR) protein